MNSQEPAIVMNGVLVVVEISGEYVLPSYDIGVIPVSGLKAKFVSKDGKEIDITIVNPVSSYSFTGTCFVEDYSVDITKKSPDDSGVIISKVQRRKFHVQLGYPNGK